MSNPHLPPETLDHIVDLLRNKPKTLERCCLVATSWVPRTRKHLFADIRFDSAVDLELWRKTFPDPSNSPAYYTHTLFIGCPQAAMEADAGEGGWIRAFCRVSRFAMGSNFTRVDGSKIPLVLFHKFSPTLKSLRLVSTALLYSQLFNLVCSFPLLEDLTFTGRVDDDDLHGPQAVAPTTSHIFIGSLDLYLKEGMAPIVRWLLSLPSGIHFRKLTLTWVHEGDSSLTTALVERCSHTLDSLDIACHLTGVGKLVRHLFLHRYLLQFLVESPLSDLSKATKLNDVTFRLGSWSVKWIVRVLQTITTEHRDIQQISIRIPFFLTLVHVPMRTIEERAPGQWPGLDQFLVQLWESRSIRPRVVYTARRDMRDLAGRLLPEISKRGIIDLILVN
jgi:hypothetical protein